MKSLTWYTQYWLSYPDSPAAVGIVGLSFYVYHKLNYALSPFRMDNIQTHDLPVTSPTWFTQYWLSYRDSPAAVGIVGLSFYFYHKLNYHYALSPCRVDNSQHVMLITIQCPKTPLLRSGSILSQAIEELHMVISLGQCYQSIINKAMTCKNTIHSNGLLFSRNYMYSRLW